MEIIQNLICSVSVFALYILVKISPVLSLVMSSIKTQPASSFLLFLTTKDFESKYAMKTTQESDVPCEKKISAQTFLSSETECVSCRNNTPLESNLFFRYSISFNRFFDGVRVLRMFVIFFLFFHEYLCRCFCVCVCVGVCLGVGESSRTRILKKT